MFKQFIFGLIFILLCGRSLGQSDGVTYHWQTVNGLKIFYRSAGNPQHPAIVLLHGFPISSIMYQDLLELLKKDFYLVAPDYPAHGYSEVPPCSVDQVDVVLM